MELWWEHNPEVRPPPHPRQGRAYRAPRGRASTDLWQSWQCWLMVWFSWAWEPRETRHSVEWEVWLLMSFGPQAEILPVEAPLCLLTVCMFILPDHLSGPQSKYQSITSPSTHTQAHPFLSLILLFERKHKQALPPGLVTNVVSTMPGRLMLYYGVCCCLYICIPLHAVSAAEWNYFKLSL